MSRKEYNAFYKIEESVKDVDKPWEIFICVTVKLKS